MLKSAFALILITGGSYLWVTRPASTPEQSEARLQTPISAPTQKAEKIATRIENQEKIPAHQPGAFCPECNETHSSEVTLVATDAVAAPVKVTAELRQSLFSKSKGQVISFPLPGGDIANGIVEMTRQENGQTVAVQGALTKPQTGTFFFQLQNMPGFAGEMVGAVILKESDTAYSVVPGANGKPEIRENHVDNVTCRQLMKPPADAEEPQEIPTDHPVDPNIPVYQNGIVPLSSLPGATGVIYLDFDGQEGPHQSWGDFDAAPANTGNVNVRHVWERVSEDYGPFNLNVTTDLQVYLNAPQRSRIRCIITPTTTASPGSGGVAFVGSYNWTGDVPCWVFSLYWQTCAEAVSHEVGHALGLSHDGRSTPSEGYYTGHGSGSVSWAPIMGVGYDKNLSQWSKGEYLNANNTQDDLSIIRNNNNSVAYRADDYGSTLATAGILEIFSNNSVNSKGLIETRTDSDALKFKLKTSGAVSLSVNPATPGPNLDVLAEIVDSTGTVIASANPDNSPAATVAATLNAGEYFLRLSGVGRGSVTGDGYSDYGSIGFYTVTGSVPNAVQTRRFLVAERAPSGTSVGTPAPNSSHNGAALTYAISSGNSSGAFSINPNTGELTVANSARLNLATLAPDWDDFPGFELFVNVTNATTPALSETVRVVVTITPSNRAPTLTVPTFTPYLLKPTSNGTNLFTVTATDPDEGQVPTFSITAGNSGGEFAINASTGAVTVANSAAINASGLTSYSLTIQASDAQSPPLTHTGVVIVKTYQAPAGYTPGTLTQKFYDNITGSTLASLTSAPAFPQNPSSTVTLTSFSAGTRGNNYGSTITGVIFPPATGQYTFWFAADDQGELRLSTNASAANANVIATLADWTDPLQWEKFPSQKSDAITLQAGQAYFIQALYKEGTGGDHCAVAWAGPGFSRKVIGSQNIAPELVGSPPVVVNKSATLAEDAAIGTAVTKVTFTDPDVGETYSFSISAGNIGSAFAINSSGNITTATALNHEAVPSYLLTVNVMDSSGNIGTATVNITVTDVDESASTGLIAWEDAVHNATPYLKKRAQSLAGNTVASIDMSGMTAGNATYEFIVEGKNTAQLASVLLASTTWGLNLEAWRDTNRLGMVRYTVSDYATTAVAGKSVVTPYGRPVHVIFAVDSAANMTRIYLDGVHVGNVN